mmetsp:Transcript_67494/g.191288  ORF Transcript_67494/g.191288 Transcript_67494/m.191288 type:complete len:141 (-) Transcript_67494:148-570(-)
MLVLFLAAILAVGSRVFVWLDFVAVGVWVMQQVWRKTCKGSGKNCKVRFVGVLPRLHRFPSLDQLGGAPACWAGLRPPRDGLGLPRTPDPQFAARDARVALPPVWLSITVRICSLPVLRLHFTSLACFTSLSIIMARFLP